MAEECPIIDPVFDLLVLSRWLNFASTFVLIGCPAALVYLAPVLSTAGSPAGGFPETVTWTHRLIRIAALVALASGIVWLFGTMANMSGGFVDATDPAFLHAFLFETPFGAVAAVRVALLTAAATVALVPMPQQVRLVAIVVVAVCLIMNQASLGHAAEGGDTLYGACMKISYDAHVLAGAAWLGGLPVLLLAGTEAWRRPSVESGRSSGMTQLLYRFSAMAIGAVCVILVSGAANAAFRVGADPAALVATTYGTVLFVKLGLVAAMLGLAAYNRFVVMPRLRSRLRDEEARPVGLRLSLGLELALGLCVLGAVAVLGITPPPQ